MPCILPVACFLGEGGDTGLAAGTRGGSSWGGRVEVSTLNSVFGESRGVAWWTWCQWRVWND